jgi:adenosylcobinamide-GDP ribazoletransferase
MGDERLMLPTPLADLLICLRFFTRLPLPAGSREIALGREGLAQAVVMIPLAGAIAGFGPVLVLAGASALGLPPLVAAPLAIAALVLLTGALHEDGLADCADGFGGGRTRERKLEIMRDSRIGTFGACAVGLSLYLRIACLTVIAARDMPLAAGALVASGALSRTLCLLPLMVLPPAREGGAGAAATGLSRTRYAVALGIALAIATLPLFAGASPGHTAAACAAAAIAAALATLLARREIAGQTGDVAGATQQVAELAVLLVFAG